MTRLRTWFNAQTPRRQWTAGCAGIIVVVVVCLYGLGLVSVIVRPVLVSTPPPATVVLSVPTIVRPTIVPPTRAPTFVLPGSTLEPTPTQAPIPTRAPPTETPTLLLGPDGSPIPITLTPEQTLQP